MSGMIIMKSTTMFNGIKTISSSISRIPIIPISMSRISTSSSSPISSISSINSRSASTSSSSVFNDLPPAPSPAVENLRLRAIKLYKELHRLGRDYPDPNYEFNKRLRRAFEKNAKTTDPAALKKQLELGEHIKKEVLALISLKKFRHLRRSYHANEGPR